MKQFGLRKKSMAELFGCSKDNIGLHLKNIFLNKELDKDATTEIFSTVQKEGNQTLTNCDQLKFKAQGGKYRLTDVCDIEEMFRIIESIPSKNAEPIKQWLAKLGSERIDEIFDSSLAAQRSIDLYRRKGYEEKNF